MPTILRALFLFPLLVGPVLADVRLPRLFSDGMVLQQETEVALWGRAEPWEGVTVTATWPGATTARTTAGEDGRWCLRLATPPAGGPYAVHFEGANRIAIEDVLVGEVWLGSGQSNMEWKIAACARGMSDYEGERATRNHPRLRLFDVANRISPTPMDDVAGAWRACTPATWPELGAVAFYFALALQEELKVPIGVITADWGGTPAEAWSSRATIAGLPDFALALERIEALPAGQSSAPSGGWFDQSYPTALYNGMIAPLVPYSIRGAIWYQGEANRTRAAQYRTLFPALIEGWRAAWGQGDFPFYYVQIAPFGYGGDTGEAAELREAQMLTMGAVPNTGMAVTLDIGDPENIHPANKWEVGRRLARWALARDYGRRDLVPTGPIYRGMQVEGAQIRIFFDHTGGGLKSVLGPVTHLTVAGADRVFHPAEGEIEGETLVVWGAEVGRPVAVRYAWGAADMPSLRNLAGLPASSFRTDDWEDE